MSSKGLCFHFEDNQNSLILEFTILYLMAYEKKNENIKQTYEVPLNTFSYLFSEIIKYYSSKDTKDGKKVDEYLSALGFPIGQKLLELYSFRRGDSSRKKDTKIIPMLRTISDIWKCLFKKEVSLEKAVDSEIEYRIVDPLPITNLYASTSESLVDCSYFLSGIIEGILYVCDFDAKVDSFIQYDPNDRRIVFVIKFAKEVVERDKKLNK